MILAEYLALSDALKRLPGTAFEDHDHPAVILERATGPTFRVWGWWATGTRLPCLLWASDHGWSATTVEPDEFDSEGYERVFWCHRIKLLDLALGSALGPCPTLARLELLVASDPGQSLAGYAGATSTGLLWGIVQLRAARAGSSTSAGTRVQPLPPFTGTDAALDQELLRHGLSPTHPKPTPGNPKSHDNPRRRHTAPRAQALPLPRSS